jgi:hypothetical protein
VQVQSLRDTGGVGDDDVFVIKSLSALVPGYRFRKRVTQVCGLVRVFVHVPLEMYVPHTWRTLLTL